jgi:hypothetical protein
VSLSADKNAELVRTSAMPDMLFPMFGADGKKERKEIISSYPDFVKGKRQLIPASDLLVFQYNSSAKSYYEEQAILASNLVRYALGDAEYGITENGLVVVSRRRTFRAAFNTSASTLDGIHRENGL